MNFSMRSILYSFDPQNQIFKLVFFLDWNSNLDVFVLSNGNKTFIKLFYFNFCTLTVSLDFFRFPDLEFKVSKISRDILKEQFGMILQIGSGPNVILFGILAPHLPKMLFFDEFLRWKCKWVCMLHTMSQNVKWGIFYLNALWRITDYGRMMNRFQIIYSPNPYPNLSR